MLENNKLSSSSTFLSVKVIFNVDDSTSLQQRLTLTSATRSCSSFLSLLTQRVLVDTLVNVNVIGEDSQPNP